MRTSVDKQSIIKVVDDSCNKTQDLLATEEPLEIRVGYGALEMRNEMPLAVTMRTPGNDFDLVRGFLISENIIKHLNEIVSIQHCENVKPEERQNVVRVELNPSVNFNSEKLKRNFYTSSSCGVCGKTSLALVYQSCSAVDDHLKVTNEIIHNSPQKLRDAQLVFEHTGGLHACGLFNANGDLLLMCEDVGRHNAMDKLIGAARYREVDMSHCYVLVSGRASFELVQKAAMAGIPMMAAVGAPSNLAVNLAKEMQMTLLGFVRNHGFNIYCGSQRLSQIKENETKN